MDHTHTSLIVCVGSLIEYTVARSDELRSAPLRRRIQTVIIFTIENGENFTYTRRERAIQEHFLLIDL